MLLLGSLFPLLAMAADEDPFGDDSDTSPPVQEEDIFVDDSEENEDSADPFGDDQAAGPAVPAPPKPDSGGDDDVTARWEGLLDQIDQIDQEGGSMEDALPLAKEALALAEKHFGADAEDTATSASYLADVYAALGDFPRAEPLCQRAIKISKEVSGLNSIEHADALVDLAELYHFNGRRDQAGPLYEQSIAVAKDALGDPQHPDLAMTLNGLADVYFRQGQLAKAEELQKQAIAAYANAEEIDELEEAFFLIGLVQIQRAMGKYPQRVWTSDSGKFRRKGAFNGFERDQVKMTLKDGKRSSIPLKRLSQDDKNYVLLEWSASPRATASDIRALLTAQADLNAIDQHGWTPLHMAAYHGSDPAILGVLLEAGANPLAEERSGAMAVDWAFGNPKMIDTAEYQKLEAATEEAISASVPLPPPPKPGS